jgi:hypothetical protein
VKTLDPTSNLSRHTQVLDSVAEKLNQAAVARAKLPPSADEVALLKSLGSIPRRELSVREARLAKIEADRLAAIARAVARIPEDAS